MHKMYVRVHIFNFFSIYSYADCEIIANFAGEKDKKCPFVAKIAVYILNMYGMATTERMPLALHSFFNI